MPVIAEPKNLRREVMVMVGRLLREGRTVTVMAAHRGLPFASFAAVAAEMASLAAEGLIRPEHWDGEKTWHTPAPKPDPARARRRSRRLVAEYLAAWRAIAPLLDPDALERSIAAQAANRERLREAIEKGTAKGSARNGTTG